MTEWGKDTTDKLKQIRESLGLPPHDFHPEVNEEISYDNLETLFHESDLLIRNGTPVFAYIRDHSVGSFDLHDPFKLRKVHFSVCLTLRNMKICGRFERYQVTNRDDNKYVIESSGRKEHLVKLLPCQNCLHKLRYQGFFPHMGWWAKRKIIRSFDAKETLEHGREYLRDFVDGNRMYFESSGYPTYWPKVSFNNRKNKNFTCEECRVNLKIHPGFTDCHHINGVKSDCRDENLQCLCKICHAKQHSHYKPYEKDLQTIRQLREQQSDNMRQA